PQAAIISLDCSHHCTLGQQSTGKSTGAGANFYYGLILQIACLSRNFRCQIEIKQKVLPQTLLRHEIVTQHHLSKRRQAVDNHTSCAISFCASPRASLIAATKLSSRARALAEMSNAVPCSAQVPISGRPSVTFSVSSNANAFAGINA